MKEIGRSRRAEIGELVVYEESSNIQVFLNVPYRNGQYFIWVGAIIYENSIGKDIKS